MSFLSDQAANPLALLTWGAAPPNSLRRRRAWLAVCLPTVVYCFFFVAFYLRFNPTPPYFALGEELLELVTISSMLALPCVLVASIILRSSRAGAARKLRSNWPDYRLAGLTGRQMLRGLSGPGFIGLFSAVALHLAIYAVCMLLYALYIEFDEDFWAILVMGLAPAFAFILCPLIDVALWVLMPAPLARLIALTAIAIATSPMLLIGGFAFATGNDNFINVAAGAEALSWPFRARIVRWLWLRAIRRLDDPLPASSDFESG